MNKINLKQRFSPQHLFPFFLICAFPFHLWAIIMLLRDVGWITERSGAGSFVGVASLTMLYALAESILLFLLLLILGLLIPWKWEPKRVYAIAGMMALLLPIGDILNQVYRAADIAAPGFLVQMLFSTGHPLRYGYLLAGLLVIAVVGLIAAAMWFTSFNTKFQQGMGNLLERFATLSAIYLILDLIGFVIVIIRIQG